MRPTAWHRRGSVWDDCPDYRAHERADRKAEAAEEIAGQLADDADDRAEAAMGSLRDPFRGWDDENGWTTAEPDCS